MKIRANGTTVKNNKILRGAKFIKNNEILSYSYNQSILPKGWSFTASVGIQATVLPKGRSSTANSGTKVAVLPRIE